MAFGKTDPSEPGSWQQRPPSVEPREPGSKPKPPPSVPATPAPPPPPPPDQEPPIVDDAYLGAIATEVVPNNEAYLEFVDWSRDALPEMARSVLQASGIDVHDLDTSMEAWRTHVLGAEQKLNQKQEPSDEPGDTPDSNDRVDPLPGVSMDALCMSVFDANDLALRGRKSVLTKNYYVPVIFPEMLLDANQTWAFGQKVEYRQEWRHEGFTLGELVSSLSLLPNEELTLEVSSWQRTKSEIENETVQEEKERLEREQRRTDEETATNEAASQNGWTVSASGSISYGPASAAVSASASGSVERRTEQSERHVVEATTKATNELSLRRAVKMTQSAESGSENRTTRRIKNPNACHTVTFNFFQIVKLYDVQLRLDNDSPVILLPALFPEVYSDGSGQVRIPYWVIESFNSPAVFLTQYFEIDRDLSQEIHGFALRVRMDIGRSPTQSLFALAESLIVALKYLFGLDPAQFAHRLAEFITGYVDTASAVRGRALSSYGIGYGRSEQVTTPGVYCDSLLGRCTACEDYVQSSRYVDVQRQLQDVKHQEASTELLAQEARRRQLLLDKNDLGPFSTEPEQPEP